jgi:hypothetical protein
LLSYLAQFSPVTLLFRDSRKLNAGSRESLA